jgi:enolase
VELPVSQIHYNLAGEGGKNLPSQEMVEFYANWVGKYPIVFHRSGETEDTTIADLEIVIREWIETAMELGRPIPEPKGRLVFA